MLPFANTRVDSSCPACNGDGLRAFYDVAAVPIQSNLLAATRDEAMAFPTGRLRLAFCDACGFVTNTAFDSATQEQSARYEATQGFSATFNAFARSLARRWADAYRLRGKAVLEIGCLQGEFISMLCELAGATGTGIDPVLDPARTPPSAAGRVRFIKDWYSGKYATLPADFVCCRHTLEHVPRPLAFVSMIRGVIGTRADTVVGFEVPDTLRVLREGAFWDLYYEHCSYFTPGSLAATFRRAGFEVIDARREFDDQYLTLDARPGAADLTPENAGDLAAVTAAVDAFPRACGERIAYWRDVIDGATRAGRRVAVWGSGSKAVGFLTTLGVRADTLPYVVDINPHKHGTYLPGTGQEIVPPARLAGYRPDVVIAMNPVYREEIASDLRTLGFSGQLLTL